MRIFAALIFAFSLLGASPAQAEGVNYINNDAEYSVNLPEAPMVETIWADSNASIPYLPNPPSYGAIGEYAYFKRVIPTTGDFIDVKITFLRAPKTFLETLNRDNMIKTLTEEFSSTPLEKTETNYSSGSETLKWATLTGFSIDKDNNLLFNAGHYLSGLHSIMMIKVTYTLSNKQFQNYYTLLSKSIKYAGR